MPRSPSGDRRDSSATDGTDEATAVAGRTPQRFLPSGGEPMQRMNELGFYTLAGAPRIAARSRRRGEAGRGDRARLGLHLRALQHQGGGDAVGRGGAVSTRDRHRHRGDEPQHAPPDGDRRLRHDDAQADRRALHARPRPRHRTALRRLRPAAHHHGARWRTSPGSCGGSGAARSIFGHDGPAGRYPMLHARTRRSTRTSR